MDRLLTAIATIIIAANCASAQEFTDLRSADLLRRITARFAGESAHSSFLDNYAEESAKFGKNVKSVKTKRDEYYEKEILLEKNFIIAKTESSPFVKTVETFSIDHLGRLYRSSKRTTRTSGSEVLMEETDITSFAYGDTLRELHNYHATPHSERCDFGFAYAIDSLGRTTGKISETLFSTDTTHYEYDPEGRLRKETRGNKSTLFYQYTPSGKTKSITKQSPDSTENSTTLFAYDKEDRPTTLLTKDAHSQTELRLRYDAAGNLVWFSCKTDDGGETLIEECTFGYDEHGYICKDCRGFVYKYRYDKRGNWTKCDISRNGKRRERISREFVYTKF